MSGDWKLTYPGNTLTFGSHESRMGFASAPEIGLPDSLTEDMSAPGGDGRLFGVDYFGGQMVTFEVDIFTPGDREAAKVLLAQMRHVWRADAIRSDAGAVATLTSDRGRVTFGRPRRFVPGEDGDRSGLIRVTADFATVSDLWFGELEQVEVGLVPVPSGGLVAPLAAPLSTTESSDRSQAVTVGGELPTWPAVMVFGPITNPVVEIGPVRWEFRITLAYDQSLTVDAAPWARTILRDGAGVPGVLTPKSTRLANATVSPGVHEFVLRGSSSTGTARAVASWRPAFHTP
jgi:hypothetical protein